MHGHPMTSHKKQTTTEPPIYYPTGNYIRNPLFDEALPSNKKPVDTYALDMDLSYDDNTHQNHLPAPTNLELQFLQPPPMPETNQRFLSGPMVVRVHPDGTPVKEDTLKPLPMDDDRDEMTIGRERLPSMAELAASVPTPYQKQPVQRYAAIVLPPLPSSRVQPPINPLKQQYGYRFGSHRSINSH